MEDESDVEYFEMEDPGFRKIFSVEMEKACIEKPVMLAEMLTKDDYHRSLPYVYTARSKSGYVMGINAQRMAENNKSSIREITGMIRKELALIKSGRYDRKWGGLFVELYENIIEEWRAKRYATKEE